MGLIMDILEGAGLIFLFLILVMAKTIRDQQKKK